MIPSKLCITYRHNFKKLELLFIKDNRYDADAEPHPPDAGPKARLGFNHIIIKG